MRTDPVLLPRANVTIVARDRELDQLRQVVTQLSAGHGRSVWIRGEPGIGKSAVLAEALTASAGVRTYATAADPLLAMFPLWPLLTAFNLPTDLTEGAPERLLDHIERQCVLSPLIVVLDDAQWADDLTLAVWRRLDRMVARLPMALIAAARPVPRSTRLGLLMTGSEDAGALAIDLEPLSPDGVGNQLASLLGVQPDATLSRLVRAAGGNPSYVRAVVAAIAAPGAAATAGLDGASLLDFEHNMPPTLTAAITQRLDFLSADATEVLALAAVLGTEFTVSELALLTNRLASELLSTLRDPLAAGVLGEVAGREGGGRLAFRHDIVRWALLAQTTASARAAIHRRAARCLAAAGEPVERVANHLIAAGDADDAWTVRWLAESVGVLAYRAPRCAVELLDRVRTGGLAGPHGQLFATMTVRALHLLGRDEEVERIAQPALVQRPRQPALTGELAWTLSRALCRIGRCEDGIKIAADAIAGQEIDAVWGARILTSQALAQGQLGRNIDSEQTARLAIEAGQRAGDRLAVGYGLHTLAMIRVNHERDLEASLELIDQALLTIGDELEAVDLRILLLGNRVSILGSLGRRAIADRAIGEAFALADRITFTPRVGLMRASAASHWFFMGRWDDALADFGDAEEQLDDSVVGRLHCDGVRALIAVHRDDPDALARVLPLLDEIEGAAGEVRYHAEELLVARALSAERANEPYRAYALLRAALAPRPGEGCDCTETTHLWVPDVVRLAVDLGERETAELGTAWCAKQADGSPCPDVAASAALCQGLLTADPQLALTAAAGYEAAELPLYRAQALESAAVAFAAAGDSASARLHGAVAVDIYLSLAASWNERRLSKRLRALGVRLGARGPRQRPATGWEALSPAELKVASLVAMGLSNKDIAATLLVSRHTVQSHVEHILAKLAANSRVEIAREAARHEPAAGKPPTSE